MLSFLLLSAETTRRKLDDEFTKLGLFAAAVAVAVFLVLVLLKVLLIWRKRCVEKKVEKAHSESQKAFILSILPIKVCDRLSMIDLIQVNLFKDYSS
jgi:hypothetical protein